MIEKDYLMRMLAQLSEVLARVLFQKQAQNYPAAQKIIQNAYQELFGLSGEMLQDLDATTLALLLADVEKIKTLAALLHEEGDVLLLQGSTMECRDRFLKSLALFREAMKMHPNNEEFKSAIATLHAKLSKLDQQI
jgi:hypothetical protein